MKKYIILFAAMSISSLYAQTLSLKECIEAAIQNNIEVKQSQLQAETNKSYYHQSKSSQLPFLNAGVFHGVNQGRNIDPFTNSYITQAINFANYNINTNVILWNGGNLRNSTQRDALNYEASKMEMQQVRDNLTINVILAYLQVLTTEEQLSVAKEQTTATRLQVERLELLNTQGAIPPSTYYDLKGQLAGDELNEITVRNTLENAKLTLTRLMNIEYTPSLQLQRMPVDSILSVYSDKDEMVYQLATEKLAVVQAANLRRKSAGKEYEAARGARLPTLLFNGNVGTYYSSAASSLTLVNTSDVLTSDYVVIGGTKTYLYTPRNSYQEQKISYTSQWKNNLNSSVSVGLRIPILNGAQARTRINLAKITEERTEADLQNVKYQLKQDVHQSYINMQTAFERYYKLLQQVKDLEVSFKAAEVRFQSGVGTPVDYVTAKNNLDRARINLVAARYDYILRTKVLDFYSGKPLYQ